MGMLNSMRGKVIGSVVKRMSDSEPKTTALGMVLAGIIASSIDWGKLLDKDPQQIGNLVGAIIVGLLGYWTNHGNMVTKQVEKTVEAHAGEHAELKSELKPEGGCK